MELPPEVLAALTAVFIAIIYGIGRLFRGWIKSVLDAIESNKQERDIQLEQMRSDMRIKEEEQKADRAEKEQLFALVRDSVAATNRLADAIHEDSISRQKLEREQEERREKVYRENIAANMQLKEVLEIQSRHYQNMQIAVKDVQKKTEENSTSYQNLETRIESFLLEIRTTIDNYNDDHAAHVEAAGERQKIITTLSSKVDEILAILKPPPKPPLELHPEKLKKTDDKQEKLG